MIKPATGKWPRIRIDLHCRTCDEKAGFSLYYGHSEIWTNQGGHRFDWWAGHEEHNLDVQMQFYDGERMSATG